MLNLPALQQRFSSRLSVKPAKFRLLSLGHGSYEHKKSSRLSSNALFIYSSFHPLLQYIEYIAEFFPYLS